MCNRCSHERAEEGRIQERLPGVAAGHTPPSLDLHSLRCAESGYDLESDAGLAYIRKWIPLMAVRIESDARAKRMLR